jgi:hypothetical protein
MSHPARDPRSGIDGRRTLPEADRKGVEDGETVVRPSA